MKCNLGPLAKSIEFRLKPSGESATIELLGQCEITAEDALDRPSKRECAALDDAKRFLVAVLVDGPMVANEINTLANRSGISHGTLRRAKYDLGVKSKRTGYSKGTHFKWVLPDRNDPRVMGLMDELYGEITAELCHGDDCDRPIGPASEAETEENDELFPPPPDDDDLPEQPT
jgi:hypothetical protein